MHSDRLERYNSTVENVTIRPALFPSDLEPVRSMFRDYERELNVDLCFQGFEEELEGLPGAYKSPFGALLIAESQGEPVGVVAMRPTGDCEVEMKRLYVRPEARGQGIGRLLADYIVEEARGVAHRAMVLDTLPKLDRAISLYRSMGFEETPPYYENPDPHTVYMRMEL